MLNGLDGGLMEVGLVGVGAVVLLSVFRCSWIAGFGMGGLRWCPPLGALEEGCLQRR